MDRALFRPWGLLWHIAFHWWAECECKRKLSPFFCLALSLQLLRFQFQRARGTTPPAVPRPSTSVFSLALQCTLPALSLLLPLPTEGRLSWLEAEKDLSAFSLECRTSANRYRASGRNRRRLQHMLLEDKESYAVEMCSRCREIMGIFATAICNKQ